MCTPFYLMTSRSGVGVLAQSNLGELPQGGANSVQQVKADLTELEAASPLLPSTPGSRSNLKQRFPFRPWVKGGRAS